jgi:hypothetical protein
MWREIALRFQGERAQNEAIPLSPNFMEFGMLNYTQEGFELAGIEKKKKK